MGACGTSRVRVNAPSFAPLLPPSTIKGTMPSCIWMRVSCPTSLLTITSAGAHLPSRGCMRHSSTSSSPSTNLSQSSWPDVEPHAYPLWSAVQRRSASVQTREAPPIDLWQTIPCRHNPPASWDDHEQIVSTQKCVGICTLYMAVAVVHHRQRIMPPETHPVHFLVRSAPSAPRQGTREG